MSSAGHGGAGRSGWGWAAALFALALAANAAFLWWARPGPCAQALGPGGETLVPLLDRRNGLGEAGRPWGGPDSAGPAAPRRFAAPLDDSAFRGAIRPAAVGGFEGNFTDAKTNATSPVLAIHTIVVNSGNLDLLENLLCTKRRVGLRGFLVMALDHDACPELERRGLLADPAAVCLDYFSRMVQQIKVADPETFEHKDAPLHAGTVSEEAGAPEAAEWLTPNHVFIINAKLYAARDVLAAGFGVFLTDIDVVLFRDPRPHFRRLLRDNPDVTMIFQDDTTNQVPLSLNSGFFYYKSCCQNRIIAQAFIARPEWWQLDQTRVNVVLNGTWGRFWKKGTVPFMKLRVPDAPNGKYLHGMLRSKERFPIPSKSKAFREFQGGGEKALSPIAAHANWTQNLAEKLAMLHKLGLWFLSRATGGGDRDEKVASRASSSLWECYTGALPSPHAPRLN